MQTWIVWQETPYAKSSPLASDPGTLCPWGIPHSKQLMVRDKMDSHSRQTISIGLATAEVSERSPLTENTQPDVCIVGAGT
jgi:hypothetical protein